jgi:aminopeptidase N
LSDVEGFASAVEQFLVKKDEMLERENRRFASLMTGLMVLLIVITITACAKPAPTATSPTAAPKAVPTSAPSEEPVDDPDPTDASAQEPAPAQPDPAQPETDWDDREVFRAGLIGAEQAVLDQLPGATVYHISLEIPDDFLVLSGHQDVRYTNQESEPLNEVYFRLFPNVSGGALTVSEVRVNGENVEPAYEARDSSLRVPLPTALQPGGQVVIQMDFEVQVTREMAGNYGLFGYFDEVLVLDEFYPAIPAYDDDGWYAYAPAPNGDLSYFDASFYLVRVTAPANLIIVAPGIEVDREQDGNRQIVTIAAGPARDFYLAASEHYVVVSETVGETTVNSYAFAEWENGAELALEITARALSIFSERFGAYPYTEFDVASTPMQALGIEYPGMTGITLNVYDLNAEVSGLPAPVMMESVVAHEVGHQWFYNVVGNDQMGEPWMDEAIVQYIIGLYYVDAYGESVAQSYRDSWGYRWNRVERAEIPIGLPAGDYEGSEYGAIVYGRGPLFVQALAKEMGQETFDAFLRDYYETHKWGIGTGDAFRQLAEQHCQCDLTDLFETWVYEK